jgi:hypothetical protein
MTNTFTTTGGTSHSRLITGLTNGQTYNYYVRCNDTAGNFNTNDYAISFSVAAGSGNTITALSCSQADVNTAINSASDGYTVIVPAGNCTWGSTISITKALVIRGAGANYTIIFGSGFFINPGSDKAVRITGFGFWGGTTQILIRGSDTNAYCLTKIRIDHNNFIGYKDQVWAYGWVEGLIDHNYFFNVDRSIMIQGDDDYAWQRTIQAGTSHALFIEDNLFKWTNAGGGGMNEAVYHQDGGRTVTRYNTFDGSEYTNYDYAICDSHGNFGYYSPAAYPYNTRGQSIIEIYNNNYIYDHTYRIWYFVEVA